uniref:Uncharacterized protein n=1 Tax=Strongyloides venezuelensis TaxID=75913 RepID=A0A0K0ETV3_STRVS
MLLKNVEIIYENDIKMLKKRYMYILCVGYRELS